MKKVKLNLGSGNDYKEEYINVDVEKENKFKFDLEHDLTITPYPFENESVDLIECHHVLEHLFYDCYDNIFKEWFRILKQDGLIILSFPDFVNMIKQLYHYVSLIENLVEKKQVNDLINYFWDTNRKVCINGDQTSFFDCHISMFDYYFVEKKLYEAGFKNVERVFEDRGVILKITK